jgi:hypothetical protein
MSIVDDPAVATISGSAVVAVADPAVVPVVDPTAVALADFAAVTTIALLLLLWLTLLLLQWLTLAACVVMWGPCLTELLLSKWELGKLFSGSIHQILYSQPWEMSSVSATALQNFSSLCLSLTNE